MKAVSILISSALTLLLFGCSTTPDAPDIAPHELRLPELKQCTPEMLQTDQSFMCIDNIDDKDLVQVDIKFATDSFAIRKQAQDTLDQFYAYAVLTHNTNFTIKGFAGKVSSDLLKGSKDVITKANIELSQDRADTVKAYLAKRGIPSEDMKVEYGGYEDPIATNDTKQNRAINQRVEIVLKTNMIDQIDYLKDQFKPVKIALYKKYFSNVYLMDSDDSEFVAEIYDSREKRNVIAPHYKILVNHAFNINKKDKESTYFSIVTKPESISFYNNDLILYKLGTASFDYTYKDISVLTVTNTAKEVNIGDYVIPRNLVNPELPETSIIMNRKIIGRVLKDVENTNTLSSAFNNVLIGKGSADGLIPGAQMLLYTPEMRQDGYPVPPKFIGYGFVYRLSDHYALIMVVNSVEEITDDTLATTRI